MSAAARRWGRTDWAAVRERALASPAARAATDPARMVATDLPGGVRVILSVNR